ncbi:32025_t:CDS:2, partial [Racocetra persica]
IEKGKLPLHGNLIIPQRINPTDSYEEKQRKRKVFWECQPRNHQILEEKAQAITLTKELLKIENDPRFTIFTEDRHPVTTTFTQRGTEPEAPTFDFVNQHAEDIVREALTQQNDNRRHNNHDDNKETNAFYY